MAQLILLVSVPIFILLMGAEMYIAKQRGLNTYHFADTVNNLAIGMGSEVFGVLSKGLGLLTYSYAYKHWQSVRLDPVPMWLLAFVGVDFLYYWSHRLGHDINFLWAFHSVHHQSECYNFSVALRQSWFGSFVTWVFYLPLAIVGVTPETFAVSMVVNLLYQFLLHTQLIGNLGWLEVIFNTPSHHRVHHGTNFEYIDRNYGGVLILWDRWFGTFAPEVLRPTYGIVKPWQSFSAWTSNLGPVKSLIVNSMDLLGPINKLRYWLKPPGWEPIDRTALQTRERLRKTLAARHPIPLLAFNGNSTVIFTWFAVALGTTTALMSANGTASGTRVFILALGALLAIHIIGKKISTNEL